MKKLLYIFLLLLFNATAFSQVDRSQKPEPGPAPVIELGKYETFELKNGLKVIVVENDKLPRIAFNLIVDRDPVLEGDKVGYTSMAGQMLRRGTTNRSKDELDKEIDYIGASVFTGSNSIYAASLTRHQEKLLELMTDILYNPTFPEEELDKIKKQTLSNLASQKDAPDAIAGNVSRVLNYGKEHPYGEVQKEEHVNNIMVEDLKNYYQTYFKPNVSYLAIVGDIKTKDAKKLAEKYFGKWEKGNVPENSYETPKAPEETFVALVDRPASVQTVLDITYPVALEIGSPDAIKARVMNQVFGGGSSGRLFMNIREDKGYTYGAYSSLNADELIGNFNAGASVRNEVTDSATYEFLNEMKKIQNEEVTDKELMLAKNTISGAFARSLENPQTIANFAINTQLYNLPEDYYANYVKNVQNVSKSDVKAMAKKYIKPDHSYIVTVGKASDIEADLKNIATVQYYDMYGNKVDPAESMALMKDKTANEVIQGYLKAIGGVEKLKDVKSLRIKMNADMMGNKVEMAMVKKEPRMLLIETGVGGNIMSKQLLKGEEASVTQMGNKVPMNDEIREQLVMASYPFPEIHYKELGVETKLIGVEKVDGKEAYVVEVKYPKGGTVNQYYDTESGFKVRESKIVKTQQGEMSMATDYGDYKQVNGIYFPHLIVQPIGNGMKMNVKTESLEVNPEVSDDVFN